MPNQEDIAKALGRGVAETIVPAELNELLSSGKSVRLKMGFDPSAPDIHLGHVVGLRKLRDFQELGHKVVLIVGDWTARIGDPSGRSQTRRMLSAEEVKANAETYMAQFFSVVDREKTEVRWQSEWFGDFSLADVIGLTSRFTVAQFLAREDFAKRFAANQPIAITELLYPLLQAYDSVAIESDIEFGGMDQKFNLLVGRDLQEMLGQTPQQLILMPLLVGTDGAQKMSKSLGNYIAVADTPQEMFGKTMSLADDMIMDYFELLTDVPEADIAEMRRELSSDGLNPMELKKRLGEELVTQFHDAAAARGARGYFEQVFQSRTTPDDMPTVSGDQIAAALQRDGDRIVANMPGLLTAAVLAGSNGEARRLISQGGVEVDGERVTEFSVPIKEGSILKVGRRRWARIVGLSSVS